MIVNLTQNGRNNGDVWVQLTVNVESELKQYRETFSVTKSTLSVVNSLNISSI